MRTGEQVKLPRAEAVQKAKAFVEADRRKPVICETPDISEAVEELL